MPSSGTAPHLGLCDKTSESLLGSSLSGRIHKYCDVLLMDFRLDSEVLSSPEGTECQGTVPTSSP